MFTGYLEQAQFPDSSFDAITLIEIVEHLRDAKALLAECARILKPGGIVLVTTPTGAARTRCVGLLRSRSFDAARIANHPPQVLSAGKSGN